MLIKILIIIAGAVLIAVIALKVKKHNESIARMYRAAGNVLKNEELDAMLHNPMLSGYQEPRLTAQRLMCELSVLDSKPLKEYVFDPQDPIRLGRDKKTNSITLSEAIVSLEHCVISEMNGSLCIRDLGSANGTMIRRGLRSYSVTNGQQTVLEDKDIIIIGTTELRIRIFVYDRVWM